MPVQSNVHVVRAYFELRAIALYFDTVPVLVLSAQALHKFVRMGNTALVRADTEMLR